MSDPPEATARTRRAPPAPLGVLSNSSLCSSSSSLSSSCSGTSPGNPFSHIITTPPPGPSYPKDASMNREHPPRRCDSFSKRLQQEAAAIAATHYSALAEGIGSSAHRPPRTSSEHHHHHAPSNGGSTDLVSALYRRILDLELENQQLRESRSKAELKLQERDDGSEEQEGVVREVETRAERARSSASTTHSSACNTAHSYRMRKHKEQDAVPDDHGDDDGDDGEEEDDNEEDESRDVLSQEAKKGRPRVRVRPARYPLGISRYSWPPGSPNSSLTRSFMDALEEINNKAVPTGAGDKMGPTQGGLAGRSTRTSHPNSHDALSTSSSTPLNFSEFVIVGISPRVLNGEVPPEPNEQKLEILERMSSSSSTLEEADLPSATCAGGSGPADCGVGPRLGTFSTFSSTSSGDSVLQDGGGIEKIADFCFPQGGRLELAPVNQLDLYTGSHRDQTHVLQFTDSLGATTYGVCITIYEACTDGPPGLHKVVKDLRQKHLAAQRIQTFIRRRSGSLEGNESQLNNLLEEEEDGGWVRKGLLNHVRTRMKKLQLAGSGWGTPRQGGTPVNRTHRQKGSNEGLFGRSPPTTTGGSLFGRSPPVTSSPSVASAFVRSPPPPSPPRFIMRADCDVLDLVVAAEAGPEKRRVIPEAEYVVVAPRCFCLISSQPNHPVLYKVLQLIVDRERMSGGHNKPHRSRSLGLNSPMKRRHSCNTFTTASTDNSSPALSPRIEHLNSSSSVHSDRHVARRQFLCYVQGEVTFPASSSTTLSFSRYANAATRIDFPLVPLHHWTTAVLFSRVSAELIVKCINLLLLETSLIIVGQDLGLVSAIGTALISLLAPFQWDGVFIPLLPSSLSDFLQSPVPLVVGVVPPFDSSRHPGAAVLHIGRHGEHLRTPHLQVKLPLCYQLLQELHEHCKIFSVRRSRWANLHLSTYMNGLTQDESAALLGLSKILRGYVENLCGDLKYRDAWRKYGAFNSTTQDFEFYPGWFLGPLQMMLDFQSAIVHTQMFVSYIDRRRAEDLEVLQQRLRSQHFIGIFCFYKFIHRRRRERQREQWHSQV